MFRLYLYARVRFLSAFCTRDRGCSKHPAFPAPSLEGQFMQASGASRRENAKLYPPSLPATNAERLRKGANATKQSIYPLCREVDCFAEPVIGRRFAPTRWLAMTRMGRGVCPAFGGMTIVCGAAISTSLPSTNAKRLRNRRLQIHRRNPEAIHTRGAWNACRRRQGRHTRRFHLVRRPKDCDLHRRQAALPPRARGHARLRAAAPAVARFRASRPGRSKACDATKIVAGADG